MKDTQKYVAEFIGTFALVAIGCGSAVVGAGHVGIAFAFGLTVLALVYAIGPISGCHVNPAISVAMLVAGKMKGKDCLMYIIAQCLGALVGAAILLAIANGVDGYDRATMGLGNNGYGEGTGPGWSPADFSLASCFLAEVVLTALFLFIIFGSTSKSAPKGFAGISIGFSLVFIHLVGIPITGTSVNPARSLGPALIVAGDALTHVWLFIVAPILGAIVAALVWKLFFDSGSEEAAPPA